MNAKRFFYVCAGLFLLVDEFLNDYLAVNPKK